VVFLPDNGGLLILGCLLSLLPEQAVGIYMYTDWTWFCLWCTGGAIVYIPGGVEATVTSGVVATIESSVHKPFVLAGPKRPHIDDDVLAQVCNPHNANVYNNIVVLYSS
jgi:hypothetical protein